MVAVSQLTAALALYLSTTASPIPPSSPPGARDSSYGTLLQARNVPLPWAKTPACLATKGPCIVKRDDNDDATRLQADSACTVEVRDENQCLQNEGDCDIGIRDDINCLPTDDGYTLELDDAAYACLETGGLCRVAVAAGAPADEPDAPPPTPTPTPHVPTVVEDPPWNHRVTDGPPGWQDCKETVIMSGKACPHKRCPWRWPTLFGLNPCPKEMETWDIWER